MDIIGTTEIYKNDDGSIMIEFCFDHGRIGIPLETDPKESSWHIITDEKLGHKGIVGQFSDSDLVRFKTELETLMKDVEALGE